MDNKLRAIRFETPDYIPMTFCVSDACWAHYPQDALFGLMEAHPLLFPGYKRPAGPYLPSYSRTARKDTPYTDDFGCLWTTAVDGIVGTVSGHPLADWANFSAWECPNPHICTGVGPVDWERQKRHAAREKSEGLTVWGGLRHGHTFLQLSDLRGYENLMYDFADEEPMLGRLIERVEWFNTEIVKHWLDAGVQVLDFADDLGMQKGPMLSPANFRKYIKPVYRRMMRLARENGVIVHMHADGDIRLLADDLIDGGVEVLNLQDLVNGIDWIAERYAGKICIHLDIDRQLVTPYGTPAQIDALIREEVEKLGSPRGGLMMIYGLYPGVPLENAAAVMDAMEKYAGYYS